MRRNPYDNKQRSAKRRRTAYPPRQHANLSIIRSPVLNSEVKVAQVKLSGTAVTATGTVLDIFGGMTQGTGMRNQFLGRKFQPIGIYYSYSVTYGAGNATTNNRFTPQVRVTLLQWEDSYAVGGGPALTGIFEDATSVYSPFELVNWENIDCLHDKVYTPYCTVSVSATQQAGTIEHCSGYIKGKKLKPVLYNDVNTAWQKGGCLFAFYAETNLTPNPSLQGYIRVYFQDA